MDDLISKRSAAERLIIAKTLLDSVLQDMPTAEKKGQWVPYNDMWECSVCGNVIYAINKADLKVFNAYCGMCGARMEE